MPASLSVVGTSHDTNIDPGIRRAAREPVEEVLARSQRPRLVVVPGRRRATRYVVSITTVIAVAMSGVIFFNTTIAGRQIRIDQIDSELETELARFEELRSQRASLRAPARLEPLAAELGMVPAEEARFADVDPMEYAMQIALSGEVPASNDESSFTTRVDDPMEQYRGVKELLEEDS